MDIKSTILKEKQARGVTILAHTYQTPDILEIADFAGDSFALAQEALRSPADTVMVCGVRFMAETVKILSPEKRVIIPAPAATCPMAEQITPDDIAAVRAQHPDVYVCCYINTTAELKTACDMCVTSSSAERILRAVPNKKILFVPDKNLGAYLAAKLPEKEFILLNGCCPVHDKVTAEDVLAAKALYPNAKLAVHPECRPEVIALADFVGATSAIIDYAISGHNEVLIGTERGVYDQLVIKHKGTVFHQLCMEKLVCDDMKLTTTETVLTALRGEGGETVHLSAELISRARVCLDAMLNA